MVFKGKKKNLNEAMLFLKTIFGGKKTIKEIELLMNTMPLVHKHFREICRGERLSHC